MFQAGDFIVYGSTGVCLVEKVGPVEIPGVSKDKLFYTLSPCYESKSKIFTPVDNQKVVMRPVLSREQALQLIDGIKEIRLLGISDEKKREEEYKASFGNVTAENWSGSLKPSISVEKREKQKEKRSPLRMKDTSIWRNRICMENLPYPLALAGRKSSNL